MPTFGNKLRAERERRNVPLADVAARTRIGLRYLEALERDSFDELPGPRGFGKLYIRAYAELLGFDPAPLIREYDDIVHRQLRETVEGEGEPTRPRMRRVRYVPPPRATSNGGAQTRGHDGPEMPELDDVDDVLRSGVADDPAETVAATGAEDGAPETVAASDVANDAIVAPHVATETTDGEPDAMPVGADADASATDDALAAIAETLPAPDATGLPVGGSARRNWIVGATLGAMLFVVALMGLWRGSGAPHGDGAAATGPAPPSPVHEPAETVATVEQPAVEPADRQAAGPQLDDSTPIAATAVPAEPTTQTPDVTPVAGTLEVTSHGVGTGVRDLRLVGESSSFREGDVVSFLTRIEGGRAGQPIRHVWSCEGRTIQSITLTLGGANWRTFSNKTVLGRGAWAVEARDEAGAVLARTEFEVRRTPRR